MVALRKVFPPLLGSATLTAIVLICGSPAHAQKTKGCSGIKYVGADSSNPFTAEYVTTGTVHASSGVMKTTVRKEYVARDSRGRIRFEKPGVLQPPYDQKTLTLETPDDQPFTLMEEEYGTRIEIIDCPSGTFVRIQPELRIATVKEDKSDAPSRQEKQAYSSPYFRSVGVNILPNVTIEDLGTREIQGIPARGIKTTMMGTDQDGIGMGSLSVKVRCGFRMTCLRKCCGLGGI